MKGIPIFRLKRLKRTAVLLGAGALVAGASLLGAMAAHAAVGTKPGTIKLNPSSGPTSKTGIQYSTTIPCPAGKNASASVRLVDPRTGTQSQLAPINNAVTAPFSGTFNATFALAASVLPNIVGATSEIVVQCFSGVSGGGTAVAVMDTFVTINAAGNSYSISSSGGTTATPTSTESATGGDTIPIGVTVASATPAATSATPAATSATPAAAPATGGGTGPGSNLALAATGAAVILAGGGLILLARQRRRQGAR